MHIAPAVFRTANLYSHQRCKHYSNYNQTPNLAGEIRTLGPIVDTMATERMY